MLDNEPNQNTEAASSAESDAPPPAKKAPRKTAAKRAPRKATKATAAESAVTSDTAGAPTTSSSGADPQGPTGDQGASQPVAADEQAPAPVRARRPRKAAAKKAAPAEEANLGADGGSAGQADASSAAQAGSSETGEKPKRAPRKRAAKAPATAPTPDHGPGGSGTDASEGSNASTTSSASDGQESAGAAQPVLAPSAVLFQPPQATTPARRRRSTKAAAAGSDDAAGADDAAQTAESKRTTDSTPDQPVADQDADASGESGGDGDTGDSEGGGRRRRRRGRRGRKGSGDAQSDNQRDVSGSSDASDSDESSDADDEDGDHADEVAEAALSASARRRRRRRRSGAGADGEGGSEDDPPNTVVHVRETRSGRGSEADSDGVRGVKGSTRLEAKRQRRRDNRDSGRRRAPILTEAEFLARRESVDRVMAVRQTGDRTQIAVLEDDILVEHYVTRASQASAVGNVYLGRVQNVLPSMEAAFVDIGRGRNGVLYAGEVNWEAAGLEGKSRAIENALSSGDSVLVQVTKDPIGHKGARLTSQISLPGRFVVYVPGGGMTGISRKLPDTERSRLKSILKKAVPEDAGVIVRTAAEGASEEDLVSDVERLKAQWETIQAKAGKPGSAPVQVYGEPDLAIRVVRDVFNDDFAKLVVAGSDIHTTISDYVAEVAPELGKRIELHTAESDLFADLRVDEQLAKALDRKVYLPSGGSLVIDRTEAMVVIDVNTGKYTGSGGNLEQTVTRNNLEAAEEIVRQLRLRDVGGIVVIDFIDMVLESNRDLVLRRLTECLGRDRTKHQVAEVTSLGLVQMTRKRVGEGLLEAFSEPCEHCRGRGVIVHSEPVERKSAPTNGQSDDEDRGTRSKRSRRSKAAPEPDAGTQAAQAAEAEKRRAAASAIAAIAAASTHGDEHHTEPSADQVAAAESALELAVNVVVNASDGRTGAKPAGSADAADTRTAAKPADTADTAAAAKPASRPRRRRAASRPAGPPAQAPLLPEPGLVP